MNTIVEREREKEKKTNDAMRNFTVGKKIGGILKNLFLPSSSL